MTTLTHSAPWQIKVFRTLLAQLKIQGEEAKDEIVLGASQGRTTSSRELTFSEMAMLIRSLEDKLKQEPLVEAERKWSDFEKMLDKKRKRVIALMCASGYILPNGKADMERIYAWVRTQKHKKEFNRLESNELSQLITAAEGVQRHFISATRTFQTK